MNALADKVATSLAQMEKKPEVAPFLGANMHQNQVFAIAEWTNAGLPATVRNLDTDELTKVRLSDHVGREVSRITSGRRPEPDEIRITSIKHPYKGHGYTWRVEKVR